MCEVRFGYDVIYFIYYLSRLIWNFHSFCPYDFISSCYSRFHSIFIHIHGLTFSLSNCQHITAMSKRKEGVGSQDDPHDPSVPSVSKRPRNGYPSAFRPARSRETQSTETSRSAYTSTNSRVTPTNQTPSMPAPSLTPVSDASPDAADFEGQDQPPDAPTVDERTK